MNLNDYQREASRTLNRKPLADCAPEELRLKLAVMGLGLAGESGEVVEHIKKHVGHGHELSREAVRKELGDVLWYLSAVASMLGLTLGEVAEANVAKLRARYPEGFSEKASQERSE